MWLFQPMSLDLLGLLDRWLRLLQLDQWHQLFLLILEVRLGQLGR